MVSYYNSLSYSQKHSANISYPPTQPWFPPNYHPPPNHQFLSDVGDAASHQHPTVYYNPHVYHQASADWHTSHENYQSSQSYLLNQISNPSLSDTIQSNSNPNNSNTNNNSNNGENLPDTEGLPSPPITVSGSEISSPGVPNSSSSPQTVNHSNTSNHNNSNNTSGTHQGSNNRPLSTKSPYFDWMKKPSYPTQPTPGKTRTKDKYRVVYTDYQRLELEKEYHTSRYITIRRKTELAQTLQLSERQVKIWFQNRRAKERKQNKKRDDPLSSGAEISGFMETKPKIEHSLLQHPLHQMSSMAMSMSPVTLHHPVLHHGHLGISSPSHQHLHQAHLQARGPSGTLTM